MTLSEQIEVVEKIAKDAENVSGLIKQFLLPKPEPEENITDWQECDLT